MLTGSNRCTSSILAVSLGFLLGCNTWKVQPSPPDVVIQEKHPDQARFTIRATTRWPSPGKQITLEEPTVVDSMIVGTELSAHREIPLAAISQVELMEFDTPGTVACILGLAAVGVWAAKSIHISDPWGSVAHP
jgi:hypothetical protein